jgi:nucleoside-diphosphate-sugar epimerase
MKVLVTGGAGYIGDCVVENLLHLGHEVVVVDNLMYRDSYMRPGIKFHKNDVTHQIMLDIIEVEKPEVVIHLAAIVGDGACAANPELTVAVNELATKRLAEACKDIRFIFASTCSVYGENPGLLAEDSATKPLSLYAGTKLCAEKFVTEVQNHVIFRLGTLYGMSTPFARIRGDLVANILTFKGCEGQPLTVFGGEQWRPMIHVKDVGRLIAESADKTYTGTFILSHDNYRIVDIANEVAKVAKVTLQVTEAKFEDLRNYKVDNSKMKSVGLKTRYSLTDGIVEMYMCALSGRIKNLWNTSYNNAKFVKEVLNVRT